MNSMAKEFIVKKTTELTPAEKEQIVALFNEVFDKQRSLQEFDNQYLNNPLGYSFHTLMLNEGNIVGHNSGIPSFYTVRGEQRLFVCNVDTMVKKQCRGIDDFYDMMMHAIEAYKAAGVCFLYGFPNDNSYPILISLDLMEDIGKMDTYCLPYRIGGIKKTLGCLNWASRLACRLWLFGASCVAGRRTACFDIEKEADSYNATRYKRSNGQYSIVELGTFSFVYKVMSYEGIRTAFLIDVTSKSARNFTRAVRYILAKEKEQCDLVIYVGSLPFHTTGMIRIPHKYEPKHFNFTGMLLNGTDRQLFFDMANWDVNLSNYDLI